MTKFAVCTTAALIFSEIEANLTFRLFLLRHGRRWLSRGDWWYRKASGGVSFRGDVHVDILQRVELV